MFFQDDFKLSRLNEVIKKQKDINLNINKMEGLKILKERFPCHKLEDKYDSEIQQFTAEDMIEFAYYVAKTSLEKASENLSKNFYAAPFLLKLAKELITNPDNIVLPQPSLAEFRQLLDV